MAAKKIPIPTLFKGAGPGTHWHMNDARSLGFTSAAHRPHTKNAIISHITAYSFPSPYVSLTTSFAVARQYALAGPGGVASRKVPGYVYEVDLSAHPMAPEIFNPIAEISRASLAHAHDGEQNLILGVASSEHGGILRAKVLHSGGLKTLPNISAEMRALAKALRDAEVLVNTVPAVCVVMRHDVF